jgi:hypothetical protein
VSVTNTFQNITNADILNIGIGLLTVIGSVYAGYRTFKFIFFRSYPVQYPAGCDQGRNSGVGGPDAPDPQSHRLNAEDNLDIVAINDTSIPILLVTLFEYLKKYWYILVMLFMAYQLIKPELNKFFMKRSADFYEKSKQNYEIIQNQKLLGTSEKPFETVEMAIISINENAVLLEKQAALTRELEKFNKERAAFAKQKIENDEALIQSRLVIIEANAIKEKKINDKIKMAKVRDAKNKKNSL